MSLAFQVTGTTGNFVVQAAGQLPATGITVLFGPSGTGKSTLLNMLAGLTPCEGTIRFDGHCWQEEPEGTRVPVWQRPLGMLLQQPTLFSHLSVQGNLDYVRRRRGGASDLDAIIKETRIQTLLDRHVDTLSGGEAQRVALARALAGNPALLLLDEPLSAVDLAHRESLLAMIQSVSQNVPILYVTHSLDELLLLADQVWLMDQGRLVFQGPVSQALSSLNGPLAQRSDATALLLGQCGDFDSGDHLQTVLVGETAVLVPTAHPRQSGSSVRLRIAARDVSLCLQPPGGTSILNILPVTIEALSPLGAGQHLVQLSMASQILLARLSSRSVRELELTVGQSLFAQVKAVALV